MTNAPHPPPQPTPSLAPFLQADVVTVSTLIACCERLGDWQRAQEVWRWMESQVCAWVLARPRRVPRPSPTSWQAAEA